MLFLITKEQSKPDRLIPEGSKDRAYHTEYARYCIGQGNNSLQRQRINEYVLNRHFYGGKQWMLDEDTQAFLIDQTGQDSGRIRIVQNHVLPMVQQYRGNAERMNFRYKVHSLSPLARKRRDSVLAKLLAYQNVSDIIPSFGDYLRKEGFPLGQNETETETTFDALYTDQYVIAVNRFAKAVLNLSRPEKYKDQFALDIALGGIGILKPYIHNGDWRYKRVSPEAFGFDTSATESDLSDANYFYEESFLAPTEIFERCPDMDDTDRKAIEEFVKTSTRSSYSTEASFDTAGKVPVYTAKWRDITHDEYGYVRDEFGQTVLERINFISPGADKPKYLLSDTLEVSELTPYQKGVLNGKRTRRMYADLWRYAEFIPDEIISSKFQNKRRDVVLNFGVLPYQEPNLRASTNMEPPYKVGIWSYIDGEILAPVTAMISPQRLVNRLLSVMENQLNNSGLDTLVYDQDLVEDEAEFVKKVKRGEPVGVAGRGRGVQNVANKIQGSNTQAAESYVRLADQLRIMIEQQTGVNEALKGQTGSPDQLVGVMQLMIQRGSVIQEPFYKALSDIFQGAYQNIVTSARRFYIDNNTELVDFVGDESSEVIKLSKDVRNENMAVGVKRVMDADQERQTVDQTVYTWIQLQIIDQPTAAKLLGKANMEEALEALKAYHKTLAEQQRLASQQQEMMAAQQAEEDQAVGQELQQEQLRQEARDDYHQEADRATKLAASAPRPDSRRQAPQ